jgi:hypothetical protein
MQRGRAFEAKSHSSKQQIYLLIWNTEILFDLFVYLVHLLGCMNPVRAFTPYFDPL